MFSDTGTTEVLQLLTQSLTQSFTHSLTRPLSHLLAHLLYVYLLNMEDYHIVALN